MQDIRLECTLDGNEYKEYEVFFSDQSLGVVSWDHEGDPLAGRWYTTASDGYPQYFQTQEQVLDFLRNHPSNEHKLSARLKGEAQRLTAIAQELEFESNDLEAQGK